MKIEAEFQQKFYTEQEIEEIMDKKPKVKIESGHLNMQITKLTEKYGVEKTKRIVEEEVYLFKYSLIELGLSEGYKILNGHEKELIDYTFKNQNEIMRNSIYEYLGVNRMVSV